MPGLLDIAASTESVTVGGVSVPVHGISAKGIAYLIGRFPAVRAMFAEKKMAFNPEELMRLVPDALAAIIACGCGNVNDPAAEEIASNLPAETQAEFLDKIVTLTMPKGVGPFVDRLASLAGQIGDGVMSTPDMASLAQSKRS